MSLGAFLAGCTTDKVRIEQAARERATAGRVAQALEAAAALPEQPAPCRTKVRSGVRLDEPLEAALEKTDAALGLANARIASCSTWYKGIRNGGGGT